MIERFNIKTTRPDKEIFYFNKDKGVYLPDGNIVIEEWLEWSAKSPWRCIKLISGLMERLYADIDEKERDYIIAERLHDEGIIVGARMDQEEKSMNSLAM